ncbi:MAG: DUF885 domain-containing protein [Burkholderiales bacterium]|nr:DUF885 domain-containing protein [Burkholderiales bacterium]
MATMMGDNRFNDKVSDMSPRAHEKEVAETKEYLKKFLAIDVSAMTEQEKLNRDLMVETLRHSLESERFKMEEMPLAQNSGVHLMYPQLAAITNFNSVKDYDDYLARLRKIPTVFEQTIVWMKKGMADGLMPPKFVLEKVVKQCENFTQYAALEGAFANSLQRMPASISEKEKQRISAEMKEVLQTKVLPAYQQLATFVKTEYLPKGRTTDGIWSLPDGQARYAFMVKEATTTDLTPAQIHEIGVQEVARIEKQMQQLANKLGYADLKKMQAAMQNDPDLFPKSRQEIVDTYSKYTNETYPKLTKLFGHMPKSKVEVRAIEEYREKGGPGAQYFPGAPDGSRPGTVWVNTGEFATRSKSHMESTALHEGVPGHHFQIAIAQELPELPEYRKNAFYTAYIEGWALYAESLGLEIGSFQDPYSYYGHLQAEMMRAIRLVVDTGLHDKKWTRQQVVDYFHAHSSLDEVEVQSETDRYIVGPAQALAYKVGQLKIKELRQFASTELGPKFDIRAFHDVVLGAGALPLDVLDKQVKTWVAKQKTLAMAQ